MLRKSIVMIGVVMVLAACSSPAITPTPSQPLSVDPATDMPPAAAPTNTDATVSTPATTEAGSAGAVVYRIVPGESVLKYEVGEVFLNQDNRFNLAVGTTAQVTGEVKVDRNAPQNSTLGVITADVSQFVSDSTRRDNAIRTRFLESARYPLVTFNPRSVEGLPAAYAEGEEITFKVSGDLTIRQATRPVTFEVKARLSGDTLSGEAVTTILMSDFGFGPISIAGILNTEDEARVTLTFVARP